MTLLRMCAAAVARVGLGGCQMSEIEFGRLGGSGGSFGGLARSVVRVVLAVRL